MNSFELTYELSQSKEIVWDKFFNEINEWWSPDFYTSQRTISFKIEPIIGGKMYEDFGDGEGLIWGEVIGVDHARSLQIRGMLSKAFGGPAMSFEKYTFSATNKGTTLNYSVDFFGIITEKSITSIKNGWIAIFEQHFIPFCDKMDT